MPTSNILHTTTDPDLLTRLRGDAGQFGTEPTSPSAIPSCPASRWWPTACQSWAAEVREFDGAVSWHGQRRRVVVLETGDERLLVTSLLSGSRISIEMRRGGEVLTEEDWPTQ